MLTCDDDKVTSGPETVASRPRMFGGVAEPVLLPWSWALDRLSQARNYWIATTRADGRPHSRPVWGVLVDNRMALVVASFGRTGILHGHDERLLEVA